jgi:manganese/zinc/iron transport system substrate-binding protein
MNQWSRKTTGAVAGLFHILHKAGRAKAGRIPEITLIALSALVLAGCGLPDESDDGRLRVVTTTTMITDLVREVGGERIHVEGLMGPGVDPHLYKATSADVTKLKRAEVIFYNGLLLEGKMEDLFARMAGTKKIHAITEAVPPELLLQPREMEGEYDPHIWFDVTLWMDCVEFVADALAEADPDGRDYYGQRAAELKQRYGGLHQWALDRVAEVPPERRILVTSHDAFNYFGRAYGFQVVGLQGISTAVEAGLADMTKLVDFIRENGIPAIFIESSVAPGTIQRISKDAGVKVGGELFSDAMGVPGDIENGYDLGTYEGMIKHNINTIVEALK